jgi:hypothetical protein
MKGVEFLKRVIEFLKRNVIFLGIVVFAIVVCVSSMVQEFLNRNSGAFNVVFSGILTFATWNLVSETRRMREAHIEPKVFVNIQLTEGRMDLFDMVIQNIGLGPPYNIKLKANPDFKCAQEGKFFSQLSFIKDGLKYLSPNQKLQFLLTDIKNRENFEINITYQSSTGKIYKDKYLIDFNQIGLIQFYEPLKPLLYKITTGIENIEKNICLPSNKDVKKEQNNR